MNIFNVTTIISSFFILICFSAFSQDLEMGSIEKCKGAETINVLGETQKGTLIHRHDLNGKKNYIEVFDNELSLISSNEIETPSGNYLTEEILFLNGEIFFFMSHSGIGDRARTLYASVVSMDGKLKEVKEVAQIKDHNFNSGRFNVQLSEDKSFFLITLIPPYKRRENETIHFKVIDDQLNEVQSHQFELGFNDESKLISKMSLDKHGNIHFVVHTSAYMENGGFLSEERKEAILYSKFKGSKELKKYMGKTLNNADYFSEIKVSTDKKGKIRCAGFYNNSGGRYAVGVFSFTLDMATKEVKELKTRKFGDKFVNAFLTKVQYDSKQTRKSKGKTSKYDGIPFLKIVNLLMRPNGEFYIVSECYKDFLNSYNSATGSEFFQTRFEFMSLVVINVSSNNEIEWFIPIPKRQISTSDWGRYYGIFASLDSDNSVNIFYNDHKSHINSVYPSALHPANYKDLYIVSVKIDKDGNASKTPIASFDKMEALSLPRYAYKTTTDDILIYGQWNKKRRLMKVNEG